jgi:hypothetical protein
MPSARPLTIRTRFLASVFEMDLAVSIPFEDAFLEPTIYTLGQGSGICIGPSTCNIFGSYFVSTSFN